MKKIFYVLMCVIFIFSSCKKNVKNREITVNDSLFQVIVVDPGDINRKEHAKISEIAQKVEYIPLQTADSVLEKSIN